jgi:copper resistance protein B
MRTYSRARLASFVAGVLLTAAGSALAQTDQHASHPPETTAPPSKPSIASGAASDQGQPLPPFIPPLTDDDRRAAFPDVEGHAAHNPVTYFVLFDQLEGQADSNSVTALSFEGRAWIGRDRDRLWFRAAGDGGSAGLTTAQAHVLYARKFSRWWDVVAGVRQDFDPGPSQTWAAFGVQGLAPYWFDVEATAYLGDSGRTQVRARVEYDLLLTNRLILQPLVEADAFGKSDPDRGVGAGLSSTDVGLRVRYEFRRELAPYVGVTWNTKWGETADIADAAGDETGDTRFVTGIRLWF